MKRNIAISLLFFVVFSVQSRILSAQSHLTILQYHHFSSKTPASTSITPERFELHLQYLEKHNFQVVDLETALTRLQNGKKLTDKQVAITIDDAYQSVHKNAFPLLKRRGWPFTVFVATKGVDDGHSIYLTWEQMREMHLSGAVFAAHSHTHPYLVRRNPNESDQHWKDRVSDEITLSQKRIKEELGSQSKLFAYPYGEYNLMIKQIVRDLGLIGIGQHSGSAWQGSDFGALPRFPMSGIYGDMAGFAQKVYSLPLPIVQIEPEDPVLAADQTTPTLRMKLSKETYPLNLNSLACFASGQGRIEIKWIDRKTPVFETQAHKPLPVGRSRYNCTARHRKENRYFWFSQQWIRLE